MKAFWLIVFVSFLSSACVHEVVAVSYGIQPGYRSFVPARIAVLGCQQWPGGAGYKDRPLTDADPAEIARLCERVNKFVITGFSGQPYMRGLTPKAVVKALEGVGKQDLLGKIDELWRHETEDCATCEDPVSFYVKSISGRVRWQEYLVQLSTAVSQVDAVLLPLVTYLTQYDNNDRGVLEKVRRAGFVLLMVDTGNGKLMWAGGREAIASRRYFMAGRRPPKDAEFASWDLVFDRLFQEDAWRDFPGRLML